MTAMVDSVQQKLSMMMKDTGANSGTREGLGGRKYVRYSEDIETIPEGEAEDIQAVADLINQGQKAMYNKARHAFGGTHARTQGVVKGELIVEDNLPPYLKQSLFATPGRYPIAMRYSSEPGNPALDDRIPQPRGVGMKVFNVKGEMLDGPGKNLPTQDIEFNSTPALDLADARTTREIIALRTKYAADEPELKRQLQARKDSDLQKGRYEVRNTHLESTRQYSQTAHRFGDYVTKYCLVPSSETQKKLYEETVKPDSDPDHILSDWLRSFHAAHDAEYLFQVQLLENLAEQPVEYAGVAWDAEKYPWQTVAKVVLPKQDSFCFARKTFWEDHMRLDPWHGLVSFRPLGSPNRLRKVVYPASSTLRRKMNGRREIHVTDINEIPDGEYIEVH